MSCKNCKSRSLKKIINIGNQPLSSHFYSKKIYKLKNYSLDLYICQKCNLVQFRSLPKLDDMYGLNTNIIFQVRVAPVYGDPGIWGWIIGPCR